MYEFSKQTVNYDQYSIQKLKIYDYVYEYALYLLTQNPDMTDAEITSLLNQISDTDLTTINNLFLFSKTIQNQSFDNITFNGTWTYTDLINNTYEKSVTASNNCSINLSLDGQSSFINITYTGSITVNGTTYNNNTNNPTDVNVQINQGVNNLQITATNGTTIYNIEKLNYIDQTPFVEIERTGNGSYNNNNYTYNLLGSNNNNSKGRLNIIDANELPNDIKATLFYSYSRYSSGWNSNNGNLELYLGNTRVDRVQNATNDTAISRRVVLYAF